MSEEKNVVYEDEKGNRITKEEYEKWYLKELQERTKAMKKQRLEREKDD